MLRRLGQRPDGYNPDFIVIEDDGTHWIVEVKMNEMMSADVLGKREAAKRWANYVTADERVGVTWRYLLASESSRETISIVLSSLSLHTVFGIEKRPFSRTA